MIDQRALKAAINAYLDRHRCATVVDAAMQAAIEAYEAALWRPIDAYDRENDDGNWILVHTDQRMPGSYCLMFWDDAFEWCVAGGERTYTHADLVERGAQFRTIAPPVGTSPAAEDDK